MCIARTLHGDCKHSCTCPLLTIVQSKDVPLDVHVVYIYTKTTIFSRNKQLVGPEVAAKLHVSVVLCAVCTEG